MTSMTKEQIKDEFINLLSDSYGYWTDKENATDAVSYLCGAYDLMLRCVDKLDRVGRATDECGEN